MATATVKAVLKLDDVHFVRGIKNAIANAKALAKQFAANPFKTSFAAGALSAQKAMQGFANVAKMSGKIAALGIGAAGAGLTAVSIKAIGAAADMETLQSGFKVFLGSAQAAQSRMKELASFSAGTPFQLPEIAAASQVLETLTQGALSTGRGLQLVGDVASATNRKFSEVAQTIGRLYAGLRSGTDVGDSLRSLQDAGALTASAVRRIQGAGSTDGVKAWQMATQELSRFDGMMREKAKTWEGLMSTFGDAIERALATFGTPLMEALKPQLDLLTSAVDSLRPMAAKFGETLAAGVKTSVLALEGSFSQPQLLVTPLGDALKLVMAEATNVLAAGVKATFSLLGNLDFHASLGKGLLEVLGGVVGQFGAGLLRAFARPVAYFSASIDAVLAKLPKTLGGNGEQEDAAAQAATHARTADALEYRGRTERSRGNEKRAQELFAGASAEQALSQKFGKIAAGQYTIGDRVQEMMKNGDVEKMAAGMIRTSNADFSAAFGEAGKIMSSFASEFKVVDVAGAGTHLQHLMADMKALAIRGQQAVEATHAALEKQAHAATVAGLHLQIGQGLNAFNLATASRGGMLRSGGLGIARNAEFTAGLGSAAHRTVHSLLSHRERETFAAQVRAAKAGENYLRTGSFDMHGTMNRIHAGDRKRAEQYVKDKQRKEATLEVTNAILGRIEKKNDDGMRRIAGALGV